MVNYGDFDEGRKRKNDNSKAAVIVDLVSGDNKIDTQENILDDISAASSTVPSEDSSKAAEVGLIGDWNKSSSEDEQILSVARSKAVTIHQHQGHTQNETSAEATPSQVNGIPGEDSGYLNHHHVDDCCSFSTSKIALSETNRNVPQHDFNYKFSDECDVLVKIMPDKFQKGYKVVHHPESNQTWIAGKVYRRKDATKPWVFVQWLELQDVTRKAGGGAAIDQFNFALASYTRVADFLQHKKKEGNLIYKTISDLLILMKFDY